MPRTQAQFAQMRDASNQKIKSAALKLFVEKGFAATNIEEIAEAAGLSKGMVYRHYRSKDALFASLIDGASEGLREMTAGLAGADDPRAAFEGMLSHIYAHVAQDDDFMNLMMLITQGLLGGAGACGAVIDRDILSVEAAADVIRRGQALGVFGAGDPTQMSCFAFAFIQGLAMLKRALGERFKMPDLKILTAFLYRGVPHG